MNSYCSVNSLKGRLAIDSADNDTLLRLIIEAVSRIIDAYTGRHFYIETATKYYPGTGKVLFIDDLLTTPTTFKLDPGGDGVFEIGLKITDYFLKPFNKYPKTRAEINPYGSKVSFADGIARGIQIVGSWGYGNGISATPYLDSGTTNNGQISSKTAITFTASNGALLELGQTILIETEQMYITGISSNTITVNRGANGTIADTHATGQTIYVYEYPEAVKEACLIMSARLWKRKDSSFGTILGTPEIGTVEVYHGLDPDAKLMLAPLKKITI